MKATVQGLIVGLMLVAGTAHADCKDDLDKVQAQAQKLDLSDDFRQQLDQLRRSALLLAQNQKQDLCEEVAESMGDMVSKRKKELAEQARERALKTAPPITTLDRVIDLESLVDATVYDPKGDEVGTLDAVTINANTGKVAYVVLSYGGFLGFGKKHIPLPFEALHMTENRGSLVLDMDRDLLDDAKSIDAPPWPLHPPMPGESAPPK